ncbi:MAG: 4-Cys prefix domain-containing protein [Microcoleaceae cyanobacterium]
MSYCINPHCSHPHNPAHHEFCQSCGSSMRLKERYRTLKILGESSRCRTFLAIDEDKPFQPRCIVKQFISSDSTEAKTTELQRITSYDKGVAELAKISQKSLIPTVLAAFEQDCSHYVVQEYIEGRNLAEVLVQIGSFPDSQIGQLLEEILPTIELIHRHHRIHGEIKPENIIDRYSTGQKLTLDTTPPQYVLVDFSPYSGLDSLSSLQPPINVSAEYAAPEQLQGYPQPNSDLYSLGVTCMHLLTHVSPFDLYNEKSDTWVWRDYLKYPISPRLGCILDRMVARNPLERYQSAREILEDLRTKWSPLSAHSPQNQRVLTALGAAALGALAWCLSAQFPIPQQTSQPHPDFQLPPPPTVQTRPFVRNSGPFPPRDQLQVLTKGRGPVWAIAAHPNGQTLATGKTNGIVEIVDLQTGRILQTFSGHTSTVAAMDISPDGRYLATGGSDKTIKIWDLWNSRLLRTIYGHRGWVYDIAFSPDGQTLASVSQDQTLRLWDINTGQQLDQLRGQAREVQAIAFSPDSQLLVTGSNEGYIELWDWRTRQLVRSIPAHSQAIWSIAISPDGQTLASGSWDHSVKLWDLNQIRFEYFYSLPTQTIVGHRDKVVSLEFSPNSQTLASADATGTVKLWSTQTGQYRGNLSGHQDWVDLQFHPRKNVLLSGSLDDTIRIWSLSP